MKKEFIICIFIVVLIVVANIWCERNTKQSFEYISKELTDLKDDLNEINNIDNLKVKMKVEHIEDNWKDVYAKLAYYIEHNELEKTEKNLIILKSYADLGDYKECIREIDETLASFEHINERNKMTLQNIF